MGPWDPMSGISSPEGEGWRVQLPPEPPPRPPGSLTWGGGQGGLGDLDVPLPHVFDPWRRETLRSAGTSQSPPRGSRRGGRAAGRGRPGPSAPTWPIPGSWSSAGCTPSAAAPAAPAGAPSSQPAAPGPAARPGSPPCRCRPGRAKTGAAPAGRRPLARRGCRGTGRTRSCPPRARGAKPVTPRARRGPGTPRGPRSHSAPRPGPQAGPPGQAHLGFEHRNRLHHNLVLLGLLLQLVDHFLFGHQGLLGLLQLLLEVFQLQSLETGEGLAARVGPGRLPRQARTKRNQDRPGCQAAPGASLCAQPRKAEARPERCLALPGGQPSSGPSRGEGRGARGTGHRLS